MAQKLHLRSWIIHAFPLFVLLVIAIWLLPSRTQAQATNRAALVVRRSDQVVETACVEFEEPQISGLELLQRSGLETDIEVQGFGALVCRINDTGCSADDCLCQCKGGSDCIYWSYWHQANEEWRYSPIGSTIYQVKPGAVEGWSWGPGNANEALPPPQISFDNVCLNSAEDSLASTLTSKTLVRGVKTSIDSSASGTNVQSPIGGDGLEGTSREKQKGQGLSSDYIGFFVIIGILGVIMIVVTRRFRHKRTY